MRQTVLFVQKNSIYKKIRTGVKSLHLDCYDAERDALTYTGEMAAIYHPPCALWCRLKAFAKRDEYEKYLGFWSVRQVRSFGGVLEQPQASSLFKAAGLPPPGCTDLFGGFTIELDQYNFGHKAQKKTWLYIVGISPSDECLRYPTATGSARRTVDKLTKHQRDATPKKFAKFLVKIVTRINNLKLSENEKKSIEEKPGEIQKGEGKTASAV